MSPLPRTQAAPTFNYTLTRAGRVLEISFYPDRLKRRLNNAASLDTGFDHGSGPDFAVNSVAVQSNGKVVVGGFFTHVNCVARNYVAHLNNNGDLDTGFDPGLSADDAVYVTTLQADGKVLVGGTDRPHLDGIPTGCGRRNSHDLGGFVRNRTTAIFIGCESNDDHEKAMKHSPVSGQRLLVYLGILALVFGIGYRRWKFTRDLPPASAPTLAPPAEHAKGQEDAEPQEVSLRQFLSDSRPAPLEALQNARTLLGEAEQLIRPWRRCAGKC